jgi:hypothetical protein
MNRQRSGKAVQQIDSWVLLSPLQAAHVRSIYSSIERQTLLREAVLDLNAPNHVWRFDLTVVAPSVAPSRSETSRPGKNKEPKFQRTMRLQRPNLHPRRVRFSRPGGPRGGVSRVGSPLRSWLTLQPITRGAVRWLKSNAGIHEWLGQRTCAFDK